MIDIEELFYQKIKQIMSQWEEDDIYAVSFFVYSNEAYEYKNFKNLSVFAISFNTEADCEGAGDFDEERWNYAFWRQNETFIVDPSDEDEGTKQLFQWYEENGIENIGFEDYENCCDENGYYIGKGPVGFYELLTIASKIGARLQNEGFLKAKLGKPIPIIVHGLEYAWHDIEATKNANPNGEADTFLQAAKDMGLI